MRPSFPHSLGAAPHLHEGATTARVMWTVALCLAPSGLWGIWQFGLPALLVLVTAIAAAIAAEVLVGLLRRRFSLADGSAFLTGLFVAYTMPPSVPLGVPAAAALFAVLVVKGSFGGLGANWLNPSLAGTAFALLSWTAAMGSFAAPSIWGLPGGVRAILPPFAFLSAHPGAAPAQASASAERLLTLGHYPVSPFAHGLSAWLASHVHIGIDPHAIDLLVGFVPGAIGELSPLLLLIGYLVLLRRRIVGAAIPAAFVGSLLLVSWVFGGLAFGRGLFHGFPLFHLIAGGALLGALFMANDPVTSPRSPVGKLVFGAGAGALTFLLGDWGSYPAAMPFAILLMNALVPMLDRGARRRRIALRAREALR